MNNSLTIHEKFIKFSLGNYRTKVMQKALVGAFVLLISALTDNPSTGPHHHM